MVTAETITAKRADGQNITSGYWIRQTGLDQNSSDALESWKQCNLPFRDHSIHCDPDWIQVHLKNKKEKVQVYFCEKNGALVGVVPFVYRKQPLFCELGDLVVAKLPLRVLSLLGYTPNIPADDAAYDALFRTILNSELDAIYMSYVKADSFLWKYLRTSQLIQKSFCFYSKRGLEPHLLVRLNGSFDHYMQRFSAKTRNTFHRKFKRLQSRGDVQVNRVTEESQVDLYLATATEISLKTWQFKRLGWGLGASDWEAERNELIFLARRGWLRAYLLTCGQEACSFITGWQYGSRFYHASLGFDPAWSSYSVGTLLQLRVLEDLYKENTPELYDFGTSAEYKKRFSTESYSEAIVWLFRRRPYPLFANLTHRAFTATSRRAGAFLDRIGLKPKVKHLLRRAWW